MTSTFAITLRLLSVLAIVGLMTILALRRRARTKLRCKQNLEDRAPVIANLAAFGLVLAFLFTSSAGSEAYMALPLALFGCLMALAGTILVFRSRVALGAAWSLVAKADENGELITTGPYRMVRHPIYSGLALIALGQAVAFISWLAALTVLFAVVPTLVWRARREEKMLSRTFGEDYIRYRNGTKMIVPRLL